MSCIQVLLFDEKTEEKHTKYWTKQVYLAIENQEHFKKLYLGTEKAARDVSKNHKGNG